jgi:hypothetical protein
MLYHSKKSQAPALPSQKSSDEKPRKKQRTQQRRKKSEPVLPFKHLLFELQSKASIPPTP